MTLNKFIEGLQKLQADGHGELQVFYRRGSSGECGELSSVWVTNEVQDTGPFDLKPNENYISIYAGN